MSNQIFRMDLSDYHFLHQALPEIDLEQVDTQVTVFGKLLRMPLLISSMTGGTEEAGKINRILAQAAQIRGIALGLGSQRAAIEDPTLEETFKDQKRGSRCSAICQPGGNSTELCLFGRAMQARG